MRGELIAAVSPLGYTYALRLQQKRVKQPRKRGRRLSILGLWQPQGSFDYGLVVGSFSIERYLKLMDWQANLAAEHLHWTWADYSYRSGQCIIS